MPDSTIALPLVVVPIYSLALALGIAACVGIGARRSGAGLGRMIDVGLGAVIGGIIGGRLEHVLLNWGYFEANVSEALRPSAGGLGWHGAVIGGVVGLALVARWRGLGTRTLLDALAPGLAVLAFAGWLGCWAAPCGYGAEVATLAGMPAWAAGETRDVYGIIEPRYNTQVFGMGLALALLAVSWIMERRGWLAGRRFWFLLALLSAGMFVIGFWRGDSVPMVGGIRADQWMDIVFVVISCWLLVFSKSGRE